MFVVWCSGLPGASACPGLSPFVFVVVIFPSKSESERCENEDFVREFLQKVKVEM